MAAYNIRTTLMAAVLVVVVVSIVSNQASAQCGADLTKLVNECAIYASKLGPKIPPSQACCGQVKRIDIPCACQYVTKDVVGLISADKAVYVAKYCGLTLQHGYKCGSYTIP